MVIRRARPGEARPVGLLWLRLLEHQAAANSSLAPATDALERWLNDYPYWMRDDATRIYVADRGGALTGFLKAHVREAPPVHVPRREVYVGALYVAADARRRGTGRSLVRAAARWAAPIGEMRLGVAANNAEARAFWRDLGAQAVAVELRMCAGAVLRGSLPEEEQFKRLTRE